MRNRSGTRFEPWSSVALTLAQDEHMLLTTAPWFIFLRSLLEVLRNYLKPQSIIPSIIPLYLS